MPGCPQLKDGYYWANENPGLGIDDSLAAKFPIRDDPPFDLKWATSGDWTEARQSLEGGVIAGPESENANGN